MSRTTEMVLFIPKYSTSYLQQTQEPWGKQMFQTCYMLKIPSVVFISVLLYQWATP